MLDSELNENQFHTSVRSSDLIKYLINRWELLEGENRATPSVCLLCVCQSVLTSVPPSASLPSFTNIPHFFFFMTSFFLFSPNCVSILFSQPALLFPRGFLTSAHVWVFSLIPVCRLMSSRFVLVRYWSSYFCACWITDKEPAGNVVFPAGCRVLVKIWYLSSSAGKIPWIEEVGYIWSRCEHSGTLCQEAQ